MIRIGTVNIDVSHPLAFSDYLLKGNQARYVAVYNDGFRGDDEVERFIKNRGLEKRCSTIEELADYVDIGFIQGCNWDKHLEHARPFLDRGKPVFIDKPIVGNIRDCVKLEKLVSSGKVILGSSSMRYAEEVVTYVEKPVEERGETLSIFASIGSDEFNYAIHAVEAICGVHGLGAVSTRFVGRAESDGKIGETYFIKFADGVTAVYTVCHGTWQPSDMTIVTTKSTYSFRIDTSKIYGALLDRICASIESNSRQVATIQELTESIRIMLAGRISRESGGVEVRIDDIPEDDPGYDGTKFEREYAATAAKIYLA